jgi:hypothetical protein
LSALSRERGQSASLSLLLSAAHGGWKANMYLNSIISTLRLPFLLRHVTLFKGSAALGGLQLSQMGGHSQAFIPDWLPSITAQPLFYLILIPFIGVLVILFTNTTAPTATFNNGVSGVSLYIIAL